MLKRKYYAGMGFALAWNIYEDVVWGNHTIRGFKYALRDEKFLPDGLRRYAEVLLEKNKMSEKRASQSRLEWFLVEKVRRTLDNMQGQREKYSQRADKIERAFYDWLITSKEDKFIS